MDSHRPLRAVVLVALFPCLAHGIGIMQSAVDGRLHGPMELSSATVHAQIQDRLAVTHVDQVFHNPFDFQVEGIYTFQLPEGAIITDLVLWIGERRVQGQIMESLDARRTYDEIVGRRIDPALVERVDDQLFRLSVFPFPASGTRRVEIEYMEVLDATAGVTDYVYPLAADATGTRVGLFRFTADVKSQIPFDLELPTAFVRAAVERDDGQQASIFWDEEEWSPDQDLIVHIKEEKILVQPRILSYPPTDRSMGYYVMWMPPVPQLLEAAPLARRVTFVVDISGSMGSGRLEPLKNALADMLGALDPEDRFNIVAFNSMALVYSDKLLAATPDEVDAAARFVRQLSAAGGTDFRVALEAAYAGLDPALRHSIVFLTDGRWGGSRSTLDAVIAELGGPQMRLFTIGVGDDVKQGFLTGLAADHGGRSRFVTTEADLETELRRLFDDFSLPVLTATTLSFDGTRVFDLHPADASVLGAGRELFQVGRYTTGGSVKVRLAGALQEEVVGLDYEAYLAETGAAMSVIHRLWAYEKVQALERQVRGGGDRELSDDILSLGLEYRLVTSRTSLFAPDDEVVVDPEPEQTDFGSATAVSEEEAATRTWLGRTFRWQDGLWVDVRARAEMPVVVVHRLEELPETLRPYAALGRRLRIVDEGRLYELTETALPAGPVLLPNAPNPFNPYTVISFVVPVDLGETTATLGIYDVAGRLVWHSTMAIVPGEHSVVWDARDRDGRSVASGVYLIRLQIGDHHATRRATLVR